MRKLFLSIGALFLVAGCTASEPTQTAIRLTFDTQDPAAQAELTKTSIDVIERRLMRYGAEMQDLQTKLDASGATLTLTLPAEELANELVTELQMPFTFAIVQEAPEGGSGAIMFEGQGTYMPTSITEDDLAGAEAAQDETGGAVRLVFTDAGKRELEALAPTVKGKALGIMARGVLMSKTQGDTLTNEIVIRGIPTVEFAQVFADDVNVGLHVTFTPLH